MNVYHLRRFLDGLSVSKMAKKILKMMFVRISLLHQQPRKLSIFMELCTFTGFLKFKLLIRITTLKSLLISVEKIRKERYEMCKIELCVLHQDNKMAHTAYTIIKTFLTKYKIQVLNHPPYLPDQAPSEFYLFKSRSNMH